MKTYKIYTWYGEVIKFKVKERKPKKPGKASFYAKKRDGTRKKVTFYARS